MKKLFVILATLVLVALVLAGCGASEATPAPAATSASKPTAEATTAKTAAQPTATAAPAKAQATTAPAKGQATAAPAEDASISLDSRDAALDKLKSYRLRWQSVWKSTEVTKTTSTGWDWTEEYVADPPALHWVWKSTGADAAGSIDAMEAWQIGDTMYMQTAGKAGENNCMSFSSEDKNNQLAKGLFSPSALGSLKDAKYVGTETVNGIKAKRYKYDEKSMALIGFAKASGEVWVAADGGYVVKDTLQWQGGAGLFGASGSSQGEGSWTWELSDVNTSISIKPPANCGGATGGLPILPDAKDKAAFGDLTTYTSATKMADAVAFYKKEMVAAGWKIDGEPVSTDQMSMLSFKKDAQTAQVTITADQGKTTVMMTITK
jgi:hypothetical protein